MKRITLYVGLSLMGFGLCNRKCPMIYQQYELTLNQTIEITITEMKNLQNFIDDLGFRESTNNYQAINQFGYIGRYQFGRMALDDLGIRDSKKFLNDHDKQDRAVVALCSINKYRLRKCIEKFEGTSINGINITESGLLAAAHLVGSGSVKKYLQSSGANIVRDGNNVSLESYLVLFEGYNLNIEAKRTVKL